MTLTCTVPSTSLLWVIEGFGERNITYGGDDERLGPFELSITDSTSSNDRITSITSTATVTATLELNNTNIMCVDPSKHRDRDFNSTTLFARGKLYLCSLYKYCCKPTTILLHSLSPPIDLPSPGEVKLGINCSDGNVSVVVMWQVCELKQLIMYSAWKRDGVYELGSACMVLVVKG